MSNLLQSTNAWPLSGVFGKPSGLLFGLLAGFGGIAILAFPIKLLVGGAFAFFLVSIVVISPIATLSMMLILLPLRALVLTEAPDIILIDFSPLLVMLFLWSIFYRLIVFNIKPVLKVPSLVVITGLFILGVFYSGLSAISLLSWGQETMKWGLLIVTAFCVANLMDGWAWEWLLAALVAAGVANAIIGIYIYFGGSGAIHLLISDRYFRAFGTFGQPNPFAGFMGVTALLSLGAMTGYGQLCWSRWRHSRNVWQRSLLLFGFYAASALILITGVFVSWSRGAWMAFAAGAVSMIIVLPKMWWQRIGLLVALLAIGIVIGTSGKVPSTINARLSSAVDELFVLNDVRAVAITATNYPIVERLAHWQAALNMVEDRFWTGVGAGNYEVAYETYRLINWKEPLGHAHNFYLNVLGETGIIGLMMYVVLTIAIFVMTWQGFQHPDTLARFTMIGIWGAWTYFTIHSLTDNLYVNNLYIHVGVVLGIVGKLNQDIKCMRDSQYE